MEKRIKSGDLIRLRDGYYEARHAPIGLVLTELSVVQVADCPPIRCFRILLDSTPYKAYEHEVEVISD